MIDWTKPLETVPDERNPTAVPCRIVVEQSDSHSYAVFIEGDWVGPSSDDPRFIGHDFWWFGKDENGESPESFLPAIRNREQPA